MCLGLGMAWLSVILDWGKLWEYGAVTGALGGMLGISFALSSAMNRSQVNDSRCEQVEAAMLQWHPTQTDYPGIYQALQCRPQGQRQLQPASPTVTATYKIGTSK